MEIFFTFEFLLVWVHDNFYSCRINGFLYEKHTLKLRVSVHRATKQSGYVTLINWVSSLQTLLCQWKSSLSIQRRRFRLLFGKKSWKRLLMISEETKGFEYQFCVRKTNGRDSQLKPTKTNPWPIKRFAVTQRLRCFFFWDQ